MNDSCHLVILNLNRPVPIQPVPVKKGDTGRTLQFILKNDTAPYAITPDCYAVFTAKKPDGTILYNSCEIRDNTIYYTFTPQTCAVVGQIPCEVRLYGANDKLVTSFAFQLIVEETLYHDEAILESASEVSALTELISDAAALITDVEKKLEDNAYADAHSAVCYTPQNLTSSQKEQARSNISAAPSGYGLGVSAKGPINSIDELDAAVANGWYFCQLRGVDLAGIVVNYGSVFVRNVSTTNEVIQELMPSFSNTRLRRTKKDDLSWNAWECENPPLATGIEYRTTERYNGKPVYVMMADIGAASSKEVDIAVTGISQLIRLETRISNTVIPYMNTYAYASAYILQDKAHIILTISDNFTLKGSNTKCTIYYCKS